MKSISYEELRICSKTFEEYNDCTVIALSVVTELPYSFCHSLLKKAGRKQGKGFERSKTLNALRSIGFTIEDVTDFFRDGLKIKSTKSFSKKSLIIPKDWRLLIYTRGHVAGTHGGNVIDWSAFRQNHIHKIYIIKEKI